MSTSPSPTLFEEACTAYEARDYSRAHDLFGELTNSDSEDAASGLDYLAMMAEHGFGTTASLSEARRLYGLAINAGSINSLHNLAVLERDIGNTELAIELLRSVAAKDPAGKLELAQLLVWHFGRSHVAEALALLQAAAAAPPEQLSEDDQGVLACWLSRLTLAAAQPAAV